MRKSDLKRNFKREIRRGFPAINLVSRLKTESNRMPVLNSAAARLGQALRETQDVLVRDALEATASVINCVGGTNGDLPTEMTVSDIDDVVTVLQNNSAEYITNIVEADLKFGTSPVGDSYGCMLSTRMIPVLNNMTGFIRKFQYPRIDQTLSTEWGGVNNVRFFVSEQGSVTPAASLLGNDVANCFVAAKESYKVVHQAGGKARFIYLPPGYNNDPCINKILSVQVKPDLIDLEAYSESHGDKAQAA
jgi:N4-gp56 family major capsid protein